MLAAAVRWPWDRDGCDARVGNGEQQIENGLGGGGKLRELLFVWQGGWAAVKHRRESREEERVKCYGAKW